MKELEMTNSTRQRVSVRARSVSQKMKSVQKHTMKKRRSPSITDLILADQVVERQQRANFNYYMYDILKLTEQCQKKTHHGKPLKGFSSEEKLRMIQLKHFSTGRIEKMINALEGVDKFCMKGKPKRIDMASNKLAKTKKPAESQNPGRRLTFQYKSPKRTMVKKSPRRKSNSMISASVSHSQVLDPLLTFTPWPLARDEEILEKVGSRRMKMYGPGWKIKQLIKAKCIDAIVDLHIKKLKQEKTGEGNESDLVKAFTNYKESSGFKPESAKGLHTHPFSSTVLHQQQQDSFQIRNNYSNLYVTSINTTQTSQRSSPVQKSINRNCNTIRVPTSLIRKRKFPTVIRSVVPKEKHSIVYTCTDNLYKKLKNPTGSPYFFDILAQPYKKHVPESGVMGHTSSESRVWKKSVPPMYTFDNGKTQYMKCGERKSIAYSCSSNDTEDEDVEGFSVSDEGSPNNPILID